MRRGLAACLVLLGCQEQELGVYNTAPSVSILSPADGESFAAEATLELYGMATDAQDDNTALSVSWSSSLDNELGTGAPDSSGEIYLATGGLTAGDHVITLTVADSSGAASNDSITITVGYGEGATGAPTVVLIGPTSGSVYLEGDEITFVGTVTDNEQAWETLDTSLVSSIDGAFWAGNPDSNGTVSVGWDALTAGTHTVTLKAEDADGNVASSDVTFIVEEDQAPSALVLSPVAGESFWTTDSITFEGEVSDEDTPAVDLAVEWTSDLDGVLSTSPADSSGYTAFSTSLEEGSHVITLTATDETPLDGSDSITIDVIDPNNWDDDGDGYTENEGDCDDAESDANPGETEICDDIDNDCDGDVNETWADTYEDNNDSGDSYDLGEVDDGFLWAGDSLEVSGLTLHHADDEDWYFFTADDDWYDNVDITVGISPMLSSGTYVLELYLWDGSSWNLEDSDSGSGNLLAYYEGSLLDFDEDDFLVRVYTTSWPDDSCEEDFDLYIEA